MVRESRRTAGGADPEPSGKRAIHIRALTRPDYPAVVALLDRSGMEPRTRGRESPDAYARQLRSNRTTYLGAFDADRLVGMVFGTHDTRKGWINRLAIDPEYRRRGLAERLVQRCERVFRRAGIEVFAALIDPDNLASVRFFQKLGYAATDIVYARRKLRPDV